MYGKIAFQFEMSQFVLANIVLCPSKCAINSAAE